MKIGILGGGQLAQMLALAAIPLGHEVICITSDTQAPAKLVADILLAALTDTEALLQFAHQVDTITFETENIPPATMHFLAQHKPIYPSLLALEACQDRLLEKQFCQTLGIPTARFWTVDSLEELIQACAQSSFPAILKTRRLGYDGKGQYRIKSQEDILQVWQESPQQDLILEAWIPFERELSCLGARDHNGNIITYALTENYHSHGILHISKAPATAPKNLQALAYHYLTMLLNQWHYVGVLAIELFQVGDSLILNEIAPRVHNSGHWTIEGSYCSQFENHIRAITNLPLAAGSALGYSTMVNALGTHPNNQQLLSIPYTHWHNYSKTAREQRKLGHVTIHSLDRSITEASVAQVLQLAPFAAVNQST